MFIYYDELSRPGCQAVFGMGRVVFSNAGFGGIGSVGYVGVFELPVGTELRVRVAEQKVAGGLRELGLERWLF